uniref:cytochrome c oxidase subunit II n=1 Tax=Platygaster robiniae TaxID=2753657 RepID=UPI002113B57D|nr:cytochrome c oxidase subunit II [Platygaster robiniae]UTI38866.1 cytochrome c oxidase subunit II [Platygaster robiniae]
MNTWFKMNLLDSASPSMLFLMFFHEYSLMIIILILSITLFMITKLMTAKFYSNKFNENQSIETVWTIMPMMILLLLAFPSLKILYMLEEVKSPNLSIKVMGNQWYWSYEYGEFKKIMFDSYMIKTNMNNSFRLLDVDNNVVLPFNSLIRFIVSSNDVIHSFAVPSMGMKIDATPGRLNQYSVWTMLPGNFYGQCSEICGANHSFMPIKLEITSLNKFLNWVMKM